MEGRQSGPRRAVWVLSAGVLVGLALVFLWLRPSPAPTSATVAPAPAAAAATAPASTTNPAAPAPQPAGTGSDGGREAVLTVPWGAGPDALGHSLPEEGAPEGPMSFAVDPDGRLVVLDQVNGRVQIFEDGKRTGGFAVPADTFQDLVLTESGDVALLDRLAGRKVAVFDPAGGLLGEAPLEGEGVPEGGGTTGLFARDDGLWVEYGHQTQVRVARADGRPDPERPGLPGRFSADGARLLLAARTGAAAVTVWTADPEQPAQTPVRLAEVAFPLPVMYVAGLESDLAGRVFLMAQLMRADAQPPFAPGDLAEQAVVLDAAGREVARYDLPFRDRPEEQFRAYRVGADGALYQLQCTADGVTVWRVAP